MHVSSSRPDPDMAYAPSAPICPNADNQATALGHLIHREHAHVFEPLAVQGGTLW
jgi:hypothetical protein